MLARSWELKSEEPREAEELARQGLEHLDTLEATQGGSREINDSKARAWVYMGNARRIQGDLREARQMIGRAEELLAWGTHEPLRRAEFLWIKAGFLAASREFEEAERLLDQAIAIYRWARDDESRGTVLITKALLHHHAGATERSLPVLREAEALIDPERNPWLGLSIKQTMSMFLYHTGRIEEADALLPEVREMSERYGKYLDKLRVRWLEGWVASGRGDDEEAEQHFRAVRKEFLEQKISQDAALVSLDLAALLLEQGRVAETKELAQEMLSIFQSLDIQRDAFAALILFHKAALREEATVGMVKDIAAYLKRASRNPALKFEEPS